MKIKRLIIEGLFDLNYKIEFYGDVNFLYGKNGCGKTTILNIISIIVSGKLNHLYQYEFNKLEFYSENEKEEKIELLIEKEKDLYHFLMNGIVGVIPGMDRFLKSGNYENKYYHFTEEEVIHNIRFVENDYEFENYRLIREKINQCFSTIYLPLARKEVSYLRKSSRNKMRNEGNIGKISNMDTSLANAIDLVKEKFTAITYMDNEYLEQLKAQIITHAFNNAFSTEDLITNELNYTEDDFKLIFDHDFWETIRDINFNLEENQKIELDINNIKGQIQEGKDAFTLSENEIRIKDTIKFGNYILAVSQLKKIKELVDEVVNINENRKNIKYPITQLITIVNRFFMDTDKEIFINKQGELKFKRGKNKKISNVDVMSSGEKQILIFFIYAILQVKPNKSGLYMIDEPELSLHLEWQHIFVESLMEILPNIQLIFATHSPEIIGDLRENCVEVRGIEN